MPNRDNFHSEEVQDIMGKAPSWVIRWGVTVVFIIFMGIFLGCYFIKYPDIVISNAEITTYNPPVELIARNDGLINMLYVKDGDMVKSGDIIAVLESTSSWDDISYISTKLQQIQDIDYKQVVKHSWLYQSYNLGELQSIYSTFQKSCRDFQYYLDAEYISQKQGLITDQIIKNEDYYEKQKTQYYHVNRDLALQRNSYERDSMLYINNVISSADFEIAIQSLVSKQNSESGFKASLVSTELQIIGLKQQLIELDIQKSDEISEHERLLTQNYQQLMAEIAKWRQQYTIIAPANGQISFGHFWNDNQYINAGSKLATILPDDDNVIIGRVQIPSAGFGKVKVGQKVNIKLNGYPYMEFGVLQGRVNSLSAVPEQIQGQEGTTIVYLAEITFSKGLETSYGKKLPMIQQMNGTAEIITKDMRLISRFFNPILSIFKNR